MARDWYRFKLLRFGLVCISAAVLTNAQDRSSKTVASNHPVSKTTAPEKPKLTPAQERGRRLLKAAEAESWR